MMSSADKAIFLLIVIAVIAIAVFLVVNVLVDVQNKRTDTIALDGLLSQHGSCKAVTSVGGPDDYTIVVLTCR